MASESIKLGISFAHDAIRFIEAEEWNGKLNLTSIVQSTLPKTFDVSIIGDHEYVPQISELIDKALDNFSSSIASASVCIDRRLALKKNFAIDKGLSNEEIRKHIEWELEQLLIAPRDEFNVDYEHSALSVSKQDVVVFVALRKAIVNFIQDIFQKSRLQLDSLDLDMFASIRALRLAESEVLSGTSALVEFGHSGIGIVFLIDGQYVLSVELPTTIGDQRFDSSPVDTLALAINKELQKLIENVEENLAVVGLDRVFFSGELKNKAVI